MVDDSEREDFEQAILNRGFELDDFELIERRELTGEKEIYAIAGTVTIKRKSSDIEKSYQAGHGSAWPAEFSNHLNTGVFG
jgi:hypothetical protein